MSKLVSIISPCYNGEKYLPNFFDSVLSQTYKKIELILIDDGSSDNTALICEEYRALFKENGIIFKYIYQNNKGQAAAINRGLPIFEGEYLSWFDSDDIMLPNCIEKKVSFLEANPDVGFVLCCGAVVDESNIDLILKIQKRIVSFSDNLFQDLIDVRNVVFTPGTIMVTRAALVNAIPSLHIYEGRQGQNLQLMLPLAYTAKWAYLNEVLYKYVIHNDSHSHVKKNYTEEINRNNEFVDLIHATINSIESMPSDEKQYWIRYCKVAYTRKNLHVAFNRKENEDIRRYRNLLKASNNLKLSDYYWVYKIYTLMDTTRYVLFRKSKKM